MGISGVKLEIVVFLLSAFLSSYSGSLKAQQTVYWKSDGINSQWANTNDNNWYRSNDGWSVRRPDLAFNQWSADGTKSHNIVIFDNSKELTTNVNGDIGGNKYHIHRIELRNSSDRTFNSNNSGHFSLGGGSSNSKIESISGLGTGSYTFNVPIVYEKASELNPVAGNLIFNSAIDNGGFWTDVWGNSEKSLTITGGLSGSGGLTIKNSTNVVLIGNALYTGQTFIDAGVLELQGDLSSSTITVASGAKLRINGDNVDINALTINAGGVVEILAGKSLTVNGALTNNAGASGLVVESGGSLITKGTVTGSATIKRDIAMDFKWHFISSPVSGQNICDGNFAPLAANFNATTGPTYDFYKWSEPVVSGDLNWINLKNTDWSLNSTDFGATPQFGVGTGYLVAYGPSFSGSSTKSYAGALTTGDQTITLTTGGNKWNLIGNPFASAIDWDGVTKTTLEDGYYNVYNENKSGGAGYEYYNDATHKSTGANGKISATQGFFVQASGTSIVLPNAARVHDNNWMKNTETLPVDQLMLTLGNGNNYDEAFIQFEPQGTTGKDFFDAFKMFSFDSGIPQIYTTIENEAKIAFNSMPFNTELFSIPVGVYIPADGEYSLNVSGIESFTTTPSIILEDIQTSTLVEINQNPTYTFTAEAGDDPNRFLLHFGTVGIDKPKDDSQVSILVRDNNLLISGASANAEIVVTNLLGQVVLHGKAGNAGLTVIGTGSLNDGIYVVTVVSGKQAVSKKISIR